MHSLNFMWWVNIAACWTFFIWCFVPFKWSNISFSFTSEPAMCSYLRLGLCIYIAAIHIYCMPHNLLEMFAISVCANNLGMSCIVIWVISCNRLYVLFPNSAFCGIASPPIIDVLKTIHGIHIYELFISQIYVSQYVCCEWWGFVDCVIGVTILHLVVLSSKSTTSFIW